MVLKTQDQTETNIVLKQSIFEILPFCRKLAPTRWGLSRPYFVLGRSAAELSGMEGVISKGVFSLDEPLESLQSLNSLESLEHGRILL